MTEPKKVPLVVYENGIRKVIGEATVHPDGRVDAEITDEKIREELSPQIGEFSFGFQAAFPDREIGGV